MKVAYIYQAENKWGYAAKTVANGFKNAFTERGDSFRFFDIAKLENSFWPAEKLRLISYDPDILFTAVENISYIPLNKLKPLSLVLWGTFYEPCSYEPKIQALSAKAKQVLNQFSSKHRILVWSPYETHLNERFFSGYEKELGLKLIQLLYCADKAKLTAALLKPEFDFLWVGNVSEHPGAYQSMILPLKKAFRNHLEYTEHNMINPETVELKKLHARSYLVPNIHTEAQLKHSLLLNEGVFNIAMSGGFQICDNPLARRYFNETELIIATESSDFIDKAHHYISHPEDRIQMIRNMQANLLKNHTYFNRINDVLAALQLI